MASSSRSAIDAGGPAPAEPAPAAAADDGFESSEERLAYAEIALAGSGFDAAASADPDSDALPPLPDDPQAAFPD